MDDSTPRDGDVLEPDQNTHGRAEKTAVGGGRNSGGRVLQGVPRGIEVLVKKASVAPEFRQVLLEKRSDAATLIDLELSPAEAAMLNSVPAAQIEKIIDHSTVPDEQRRVFLGKLGTAMLAVSGIGLAGWRVLPQAPLQALEQPSLLFLPDTGGDPFLAVNSLGISPHDPRFELVVVPKTEEVDRKTILLTLASSQDERLTLQVSEGVGTGRVEVNYDCPFESARLVVTLVPVLPFKPAEVTYEPRFLLVQKGKGDARFLVKAPGTHSDAICATLIAKNNRCRQLLSMGEVREYSPGEYTIGECAVLRIAEWRRQWDFPKS
ncbi:MAG: hypothetical protein AB1646_02525 [Thermodesulfobacteriota bacterium]